MSELKYRGIWWTLGGVWLVLVVYLSVANLTLPQVGFSFGDKINHLIAYGFLMGWFGQLVKSTSRRMIIAACLIFMGLGLELVQGTLSHRWFDWFDAVANAAGVLIALFLFRFGADNLFAWFLARIVSKGN